LPITGGSFEPSASPVPKGENEEANWVFVIRGATVHSGPSVSAPTVRFYSVGTELQLIDYQQGWFQVSDPVTSQRGWIYEKYYLEAIRGPGQMVAALQEPAKPQQEVVKARNPTPLKRAKKIGPRLAKKVQPGIASAARYRYETVASILDKALRP
jgi:Bacterial SH3 domain